MEAVACERILALEELDPAHCRHDDDGAAHAAVGAGAAADRIEAVAERRLETHRAAMALAGPNVRVAHHVAVSRCCRLYVIPDRETKPVTRRSSIPRERSRSPDGAKRIRATRPCVPRRAKHTNNGSLGQRYSTLPKFGFGVFIPHLIPVRGAYRDRHETWDELRWTLVTSARRVRRAGNRERRHRAHDRCY